MLAGPRQAPTISFVVTSRVGGPYIAAQLALLHSTRRADSELILLTGEDRSADAKALAETGVRCVQIPGASVFGLRARIPEICRKDWVFVVEDHAVLDRGAIDALYGLIEMRPTIDAVAVVARNLTSLSPWAWANFLHTFSGVWAPITGLPRMLAATSLAVRRARLGTDARLGEGAWEMRLIPGIHAAGNVGWSNEIAVDHIKHVDLRSTLALNFHNARACAAVAGTSDKSMRAAVRDACCAFMHHQRRIRADIADRKHELPANLTWRLYVIGLAHVLGTLAGAFFGAGNSIERID
jgi:hypothetical protein